MEKAQVITDAELIAEYAKQFVEEPAPVIETQAPSSSLVTLLAGVVVGDELVKEIEIRELNGADEEAIAKSGSLGKSLTTILQRGVVKIGSEPATEGLLDQMISGDRDHVMLAIRKLTFGDNVDFRVTCAGCAEQVTVSVVLSDDVPVTKFDGTWTWETDTKQGLVRVVLPNGTVQKKLMDGLDRTPAELSTVLLSGCITAVNGLPVVPSRIALSLSIGERETILKQIMEHTPGPRLLEVKKACEACGNEIPLPLSLASLFRL